MVVWKKDPDSIFLVETVAFEVSGIEGRKKRWVAPPLSMPSAHITSGPPGQGEAVLVLGNVIVALADPDRHGKVEFDLVFPSSTPAR